MKKLFTLLLVVSAALLLWTGCSKKAETTAQAPLTQPKAITQTAPVAPVTNQIQNPTVKQVTPQPSSDMAKYTVWSAKLRPELQKKGGSINNIALPEPIGSKVVVMTSGLSKEGLKNTAGFVAEKFKKSFPGKPSTIEIYSDGKPAVTLKLK